MASVRDKLREQRAAQLDAKRLTLPVKGWGGLLHVRYKPIGWRRLDDLLSNVFGDADERLQTNLDALIEACEALLVRVDEGEYPGVPRDADGLVSLAATLRAEGQDVIGEVRFDEVACDALDVEGATSARETIVGIFAGAVSPELSVSEHAARLGAWMRSSGEEVDDSLLGG